MEQNFLTSGVLAKFDNIKHGFLCRDSVYNDTEYDNKAFKVFDTNFVLPYKQLHTDNVFKITQHNKNDLFECDAFITKERNIPIAVRTADCIPILIYARDINYIAAVHCGWKGLYLKIIQKVLQELFNIGCSGSSVYAAIGPYIHSKNYEVDEKFIDHFTHNGKDYQNCVEMIGNKYHFNLGGVALQQLLNCDVLKTNVDNVNICTFDSDDFPSFRKMQQNCVDNTKRFYSFINITV
ncbi:MAG: hypothetical protein RL208_538 [Pseudomonadota bacterium]|jgi:YfiH family protein